LKQQLLVALTSIGAGAALSAQLTSITTGPSNPKVVISEVSYDPLGPDAGFEWVELAVTGGQAPFSLNGYTLVDAQGTIIYTFGNSVVSVGDTVLLILGDIRPGLAGLDLSAGKARVLFRGATSQDLLGNTSGALGLRNSGGALHDFVAWGQGSAPASTPLYQDAVAQGDWPSGGFVDISWDAAKPVHPGYTIGRNKYAKDTDATGNWAGNGGKHGVGASPGAPNNVDVENVGGLIQLAQEAVNAGLLVYSMSPFEALRFHVSTSSVANIRVENQPGFRYGVDALHAFMIEDTCYGSGPQVWSGTLDHEFEMLGSRSYKISVSGQISSPTGDSLVVDYSVIRSGFGSATITDTQTTGLTLNLYGESYPFNSSNITTSTLVGNRQVDQTSTRTETTWGGTTPASVVLNVSTQETSDSTSTFSFDITGTPLGDPYPVLGGSSNIGSDLMSITGNGTTSMTNPEEFVVRYENMDFDLNGTTLRQIRPDAPGTVTVNRAGGVSGDIVGDLQVVSNFPVQDPYYGDVVFEFGHTDVSTTLIDSTGKKTIFSQPSYDAHGSSWATGSFFVDPPVQTLHPPTNIVSNTTTYGVNGSNGGSVGRDILRVGGELAIKTGCILASASAAAAGVAAAPATGGASAAAGLTAGWKSALACTAAGILWLELF
jgi:hypothetical protein